MQTATPEAFDLLMQGSLVLARMESAGIRIDTDYLDRTIAETELRIVRMEQELRQDRTYTLWQQVFEEKTKLGSREQLATLLFDVLKNPYPFELTKTKRYRADADVLRSLGLPFVNQYLRLEELKKFTSTFLKGLREEVVDGYVHPTFNLHTVETYRSSSDSPNFQNIPRRDEELGKLIRRAFIPRPGRVLVENDFGALEFRICACFWKDPDMIEYASDKKLDIHRDQGAECYLLEPRQVTKAIRDVAKNSFVFPKLYGSYYIQIAQNMWNAITERKLTFEGDGAQPKELIETFSKSGSISLFKHLRQQGILSLGDCDPREQPRKGTFEKHIYEVEKKFEDRFPVFSRSKDKWWKSYQSTGQFRLMTGFVVQGVYSRNFLMNAPVQGPGFHCLLWFLIQMQKWLTKNHMKTKLVGEIHDCSLADVPKPELQDYLHKVQELIKVDLPRAWDWIKVPMEIEAEVAEITWYDKKNWEEVKGQWQPKE